MSTGSLSWLNNRPFLIPIACVGIALFRRAAAWDIPSLWLDDQWMALALRAIDLPTLLELRIPAPLGFVVLAKSAAQLSSDLEWPFQIVPLLAGIATIPVFFWVLRQVVTHPGVLFVTCLGVACHSVAELYSVRVKHYTIDLLLTIALLGAAIAVLREPRIENFASYVLASLSAAVFSFASLFFSLSAVHVLALHALFRRSRARGYVGCVLGMDLAVAALHAGYLAGQSNPNMQMFWKKYFLRFDSWESIGSFAYHGLGRFALHAFSPWLVVLLVFVVPGVRALHRDPVLRPLVHIAGVMFGGLLLAAALQIYPFGTERTSLFAFPLLWIFAAVGCERTLAHATRARWTRELCWALALYVVGASVLRPRVQYSDVRDRQLVEATLQLRKPGDTLLVHHFGLLALAYYGGRPVRIQPTKHLAHQFEAWPDLPDLYVLPMESGGVSLRDDPTRVNDLLRGLWQKNPGRILFLSTHATDAVDAQVLRQLHEHGYALHRRIDDGPLARLFVLERRPKITRRAYFGAVMTEPSSPAVYQ